MYILAPYSHVQAFAAGGKNTVNVDGGYDADLLMLISRKSTSCTPSTTTSTARG